MNNCMTFPDTVEEFMEQNKVVDTEQIYSNGIEFVPIFRMQQWFEHLPSAEPERNVGKWTLHDDGLFDFYTCNQCGKLEKDPSNYCPNCGASMSNELPEAAPEIIFCKNCRHNGSFDTDCPIRCNKRDHDFCSFAEWKTSSEQILK